MSRLITKIVIVDGIRIIVDAEYVPAISQWVCEIFGIGGLFFADTKEEIDGAVRSQIAVLRKHYAMADDESLTPAGIGLKRMLRRLLNMDASISQPKETTDGI